VTLSLITRVMIPGNRFRAERPTTMSASHSEDFDPGPNTLSAGPICVKPIRRSLIVTSCR
jgi:hypothetical protein